MSGNRPQCGLLHGLIVALAAGCAAHHGVYAPDCIAYAGDRIELADGQFVWDKFTDQVTIGEDGAAADRYPDYPVRGRYLVRDGVVRFLPETDVALPELHLVERGPQHYLLTAPQYETWRSTGDFANCALLLGTDH